jgi:hypothetical protein
MRSTSRQVVKATKTNSADKEVNSPKVSLIFTSRVFDTAYLILLRKHTWWGLDWGACLKSPFMAVAIGLRRASDNPG